MWVEGRVSKKVAIALGVVYINLVGVRFTNTGEMFDQLAVEVMEWEGAMCTLTLE